MATASKSNSSVTTLNDGQTSHAQAESIAESGVAIAGANHDASLSGDKVLLTVFTSNDENGHEAVQIGHNGYMFLIPRGTPCLVPREVAQVIADAVVESFSLSANGKTMVPKQNQRYAFQIT